METALPTYRTDRSVLSPEKNATGLFGQLLAKEASNERGDLGSIFFESKMARVEEVELQVFEVTLVRMRPSSRKDRVILAPDDQRRWLVLAEVLLPLRIQRRIAAVAME